MMEGAPGGNGFENNRIPSQKQTLKYEKSKVPLMSPKSLFDDEHTRKMNDHDSQINNLYINIGSN